MEKSLCPNIRFGKPCIRGHRVWVSLGQWIKVK
ncbi:MAG: DUF433 domain-containing protein [Desulfobaccales bacterium]